MYVPRLAANSGYRATHQHVWPISEPRTRVDPSSMADLCLILAPMEKMLGRRATCLGQGQGHGKRTATQGGPTALSMSALGQGHLMLTPSADTLIDATSREI